MMLMSCLELSSKRLTTANNAADSIAAHRSNSYSSNPVPGTYVSNYNGYEMMNGTVESMLVDPRNFDFRPIANSALDNLSAGAYDAADPNPWTAGASRVWQPMAPLYFGCTNQTANNYDSNAEVNDHSCDYDLDDDGVLDVEEIAGCTNSTANNFAQNATDDDGSCDYLLNEPCTEDLCWDGSQRDPSDCSCPIETSDTDTTPDSDEEAETNNPWAIFFGLFIVIIFFVLRTKKRQE